MIVRLNEALSTALVCIKLSRTPSKIDFTWKKKSVVTKQKYKALKPSWISYYVSHCLARVVALFHCSGSGQQRLLASRKQIVFVLASQTLPSCARARPQELGDWFWTQNLWLSSWIAFRNDCQMPCSGQRVVKVLSAHKSLITVV